MKTEDYNKLKELCDANGFELMNESVEDNDKFFVVKKKDIWDGVEYFTVKAFDKVYILDKIDYGLVWSNDGASFTFGVCIPSTEEDYIEQLKKEAFERFGEIKEGDVFDRHHIAKTLDKTTIRNSGDFDYNKNIDALKYRDVTIYYRGKWAKKIEKAEVRSNGGNTSLNWFYFKMNEEAKYKCNEIGYWNVCEFLAKQLEDYLNSK